MQQCNSSSEKLGSLAERHGAKKPRAKSCMGAGLWSISLSLIYQVNFSVRRSNALSVGFLLEKEHDKEWFYVKFELRNWRIHEPRTFVQILSLLLLQICCIFFCQVTAIVDENNPLDQVVPPRADGLNHDLAAYIFSKTSKLALPENEKQVRWDFLMLS